MIPEFTGAFTVEAWVALQAYPWNWTALVDQQGEVIKPKAPAAVQEEPPHPQAKGARDPAAQYASSQTASQARR